jgi:hypothetical protein
MATVNEKMTAIANAIRAKSGKTGTLTLDAMATEISKLGSGAEEAIKHADIPEYVKEEALRVANLVQAARKDDSIVFLAMSDNHHYGAQADSDTYPDSAGIQTDESNLHAAMAAKILAYSLNFDFMAHLGDNTWGSKKTTSALLKQQGGAFYDLLKESHKDIPCFHAIGNHDTGIYYHDQMITDGNTGIYTESGDYLYNAYTALSESDDTVFGGVANGGYCYRDFADKKLRVFLLNTSESLIVIRTDNAMLGSQRKWFADALVNLNSKSDAASWKLIVLCHYPADYGNTMPLSDLLKAYVDGKSITIALESGGNSTVSFAGKNSAKMVAQFHGHVHNFLASKLTSYATGSAVQYDAWRVCIPNGQFDRENYYTTLNAYPAINFQQDVTYEKTAGTAKDTSFVVNVVNPGEQKIYSICYGAGVDRVIGYAGTVFYSVTTNLKNVTLTGGALSIEAGKPYSATLTIPANYEWKKVAVTMGGTDVTASVYSNGVINIPAVTGNVSITASAAEILPYTNQIPISTDTDGSVFNGVGWQKGYRLSSSGVLDTMSNSYVTGFIPVKAGDIVRLKNVSYENVASGTLTNSNQRICFYNSSKTHIGLVNAVLTNIQSRQFNDAGHLIQFTVETCTDVNVTNAAYIRMNAAYIGDDSVITVNEEIV